MEAPQRMVTGAVASKDGHLAEVVLIGESTELGRVVRWGPGAFRDAQHLAIWINIRLQSREEQSKALLPDSRRGNQESVVVFMCHSSGDKPAVRTLYRQLQADGFQPWLDEESL